MTNSVLVVSGMGSFKLAFLSLAIAFSVLLSFLPCSSFLSPSPSPSPSLSSFIPPPSVLLSSLLTSCPIFVLANFILLAILISSGSLKFSDIFASIASLLQPSLLKVLIWRRESASGVRETMASAGAQRLPDLRHEEQLATIDESKRALATSIPVNSIVRSKSHQGRPTAMFRKTLRKAESMDNASVVLSTDCDNMSSSMIVTDRLPIANVGLNDDDDFHRKCEDFIAKVRANIKKEAQE